MQTDPTLLIMGGSLLAASLIGRRLRRFFKNKHRHRVKSAARIIERVSQIETPGAKLAYLRKIDPFTFEEVVLTLLERRGCQIKRNKRYTGDGGIDGQVWINGEYHLIQAKRYKSHINAKHVEQFAALVAEKGCRGLFVHTGRTGKGSRTHAAPDSRVTIVSGQRLINLLSPTPVK